MTLFIETLGTTLIAQGIGLIFGSIFRRNNIEEANRNLQKFLDTVSKDFQYRVETIVKYALMQHQFDQVKTDLFSSMDRFKRYIAIKDLKYLQEADSFLTSSRSLLTVIIQKLVAERTPLEDPSKEGEELYRHLKGLKNCMIALEGVAALDLTILAHFAARDPNYNPVVVTRVDEYTKICMEMMKLYLQNQPFRYTQAFEHDVHKLSYKDDENYYVEYYQHNYKGKLFLDGKRVYKDKQEKMFKLSEFDQIEPEKKRLEKELLDRRHLDDSQKFYYKACWFIKNSPTSMEYVVKTWGDVKKAFN